MAHLLARSLILLLLFGALASAAAADALVRVQLGDVANACREDAARLCPGVAGGGRAAACLVAQMPAVSRECHNALAVTAALKSCELDYHRFCRGVLPGGGRVLHCLADNAPELSPPCRAALRANAPGYGR